MAEEPGVGGEPQTFGRCTECERVYPVQRTDGDAFRPIGTAEGRCSCGNDTFEPVNQ